MIIIACYTQRKPAPKLTIRFALYLWKRKTFLLIMPFALLLCAVKLCKTMQEISYAE